jgi:hypothetical protein
MDQWHMGDAPIGVECPFDDGGATGRSSGQDRIGAVDEHEELVARSASRSLPRR